ncbi:MAG TPA: KR domain-containing protein, partial [Gemmatimonadaceae bacterium]
AQATGPNETASALRPAAAAIWGFAGAVAAEHPELACRLIDLDPAAPSTDVSALVGELLTTARAQDSSTRIAIRGATRLAPRLQRRVDGHRSTSASPIARGDENVRPVRLEAVRPGTLDGLAIRPTNVASLADDEVRIRVAYAGLNFRDVLIALGAYPDRDTPIGVECAGTVIAIGSAVTGFAVGDSVFGFAPGSMASEVTVPAAFIAHVPSGIRIERAAALAVPFLTAWYGLHNLAGLRAGERVLIHAGAGGVGMAAIQLARRAGAQVYATAGTSAKRARLLSMGVSGVFDSRSLDFAAELMAQTNGAGVDVVLNSLAGDFIPASLDVLAPNGRFLELGKRDVWSPAAVAIRRPDVRYFTYDLGAAAHADRTLLPPMLTALVAALHDGSVEPLPVKTFAFEDAQDAFRYMAQARHVGKIVLRAPRGLAGAGVQLVRADGSYWITGGLGALGLRTARWLIGLGARHIVLSGRYAPSAAAQTAVAECEALGATVHIVTGVDAGDEAAMRDVASAFGRTMPPLRGVIHAAGILDDGVLVNQTWTRARGVIRGKARGAQNLHMITREHSLDFFVLYSAAGVFLGPAGQATYAAANAELDALAHARQGIGLPALSVAWGMWGETGMAADAATSGHASWATRGLTWLEPGPAFKHLEQLLREHATAAIVLAIDWGRFLSRLPAGIDRAFFADVAPSSSRGHGASTAANSRAVVAALLATPAGQRREAVVAHLRERALRILDLDPATSVDERAPLKDFGLDSLMAVELRNALTRSLDRPLPATLLFDYPSLDALATYLIRTLDLDESGSAAVAPTAARAMDDSAVAALSDDEAEALLLAELDAGMPPRGA